ncbi:MAG: L-ribulose-5-phosphate 4-epimerase AraD [Lentisphaeria bacterium]|nr:L-ribulose-5-phosphate 4-epimerase AraD [Lentisphaeria bacterium]
MGNGLQDLRERVFRANLDLVAKGLVIETWGNVSAVDRARGLVVIKPSGVPYDRLESGSMVVTDLDGTVVEGDLQPSSDLATHLEIYRCFPRAGGVAHTHSPAATAFAQARAELPCLGTTHADHFHGSVPVTREMTPAETAADYERNTGRVIIETFRDLDPAEVPAVLVASHGPFTWGDTCEAAVRNSIVLETVARMALDTARLGALEPIPSHLLERHFRRKHGPRAYYGQSRT